MELLAYTKEHKQFRERIQDFIKKELIPYVDQWEQDRIIPKSFWKRMGSEGLLCTSLAPEYGGAGLDLLYSVILLEETSRTNQAGLGVFMHSDVFVPYITTFGSEEIKKKYLPGCVTGEIITALGMTEPDVGSDVSSITTTAVEDGADVILNGAKIFISNGINCGLVILAAKDPSVKDPYKALSLYLVEDGVPGFIKGNKLDKLGMHSQDTAELFFTDCRIPKKNILGKKGWGFKIMMEKLQQERLFTSLWAVSKAEYILDQTLEFYKSSSGSGGPVFKSQANQFNLVQMATEVKIGRTFIDKLIVDHMENKNIVKETSMAKYWMTALVQRVADNCLDVFGDQAAFEACPVVRHWRDVRSWPIFAGTNEIMKVIVSKFMEL